MLQFIIGVIIGAIVSFFVFAICSMAGTDDRTDDQFPKTLGDSDASSK